MNKSTGNRFPVPSTREERAEYVAAAFEEWSSNLELATQVEQLRADFRALKLGERIMECRTWTEFCKKVLRRTTRAVRYLIAGGNPRWKRKSSAGKFNWKDAWHGMPEFGQDDLTPFKTIYVHFESQEDVNQFAELIGQKITLKTRFIWHPQHAKECHTAKRYVDAKAVEKTT